MVAQANETSEATDATPATAAPLRALKLAFCSCLRQAAIGIGDPARPAASVMCGVVFASFGLLVYTKSSLIRTFCMVLSALST